MIARLPPASESRQLGVLWLPPQLGVLRLPGGLQLVSAVPGERVALRCSVVGARGGGDLCVVRQQTFLPVKQLLGRHVEFLSLAVADWNLLTLIVGDLLAVRSGLGGAVRGALDLKQKL